MAEVENLFCTEEVLNIVSTRLARDPVSDFQTVVNHVFKRLRSELDTQVSLRVVAEVKFLLNKFDASAKGVAALSTALQQLTQGIDVPALYAQFDAQFSAVLSTSDYKALLALYNRKSLASQISCALGLKSGELAELVVRLARTDERSALAAAIKLYLGPFGAMVA